jgi:hypothetical protein
MRVAGIFIYFVVNDSIILVIFMLLFMSKVIKITSGEKVEIFSRKVEIFLRK